MGVLLESIEALEQIQLKALRMFLGIGTLHPRVSLLLEVGDLHASGVVGKITSHRFLFQSVVKQGV